MLDEPITCEFLKQGSMTEVLYIDSGYIEDFIRNYCDIPDFFFQADQESHNDDLHLIDLSPKWFNYASVRPDEVNRKLEHYQRWRSGSMHSGFMLREIMHILALYEVIPRVVYLISEG